MRRQRDSHVQGLSLFQCAGCTEKAFLPSLSSVVKPFLLCASLRLHTLQLAKRERKQEVWGGPNVPIFCLTPPWSVPSCHPSGSGDCSDSTLATASAGVWWPFYVSVSGPRCAVALPRSVWNYIQDLPTMWLFLTTHTKHFCFWQGSKSLSITCRWKAEPAPGFINRLRFHAPEHRPKTSLS